MSSSRSWATRAFRIATLVVPSWLAWYVACGSPNRDELTRAVSLALGPFWVVLSGAILLRAVLLLRRRQASSPSVFAQLDVLTGPGSALAWLSAFAIMCAVWLGWASLAVVGLLGTGLFHVVVLLTFLALARSGGDPTRGATISRRFSPEVVTEGDEVTEELRLVDVRIPIGFRLFVTGRLGPRWATTRHVLEAEESGGEILLESEIGPAVRGQFEAEPLQVWLSDTFGLCRSLAAQVAPAQLTVLPQVRAVDKTVPLMDRGMGPRAPRATPRLPTEGSFRLREYQAGDDVRRIHWVRSLAAGELIVRLPDEIPPDQPRVRLVLDTFFPEVFALSCDAPAEMLDALVRVWLGVGRALAESGVRVTLVAAVPRGETIASVRQDVVLRAPGPALRLGAEVVWQSRMPVDAMLTDEATFVVSRGVLAHPPPGGRSRWIVVQPQIDPELAWPFRSSGRLPFPMGSSENRWLQRQRAVRDFVRLRAEHARAVMVMGANVTTPPPGSFAARPGMRGSIRLEALG